MTRYILGGMAALALMVAAPVKAEVATMVDSDLDGITAKGNASVTMSGYTWVDAHGTDGSDHKGAVDNAALASTTLSNSVNAANVWGSFAGANAVGDASLDSTASATSNAGIGGF
ncbi:MAG TPA: hypothetical protein VI702_02965 [Nitrospiria bacterium]